MQNEERDNNWKDIVAWNRRHSEFISDYGCFDCDMFCECSHKCGDVGFKCPLENPSSQIYKKWVVSNFSELSDVVEEPTFEEWETIKDLNDTCKLNFVVDFPYVKNLDTFIREHQIDSKDVKHGNTIRCRFNGTDLRKRLVALRRFDREEETSSDIIANALEEMLIPLDKQLLFKPLRLRSENIQGDLCLD